MLGLAAISPAISDSAVLGAAFAQISLRPSADGSVTVLAEVIAFADIVAQAELKVVRRGAAGEIVSSQSRIIDMEAGERATIAHLNLSLALGDELTVSAVIRNGAAVISTATIGTGSGS